MTTIAFVGDVHGSIDALDSVLAALQQRSVGHTVFLGDYVNKGPASAAVLERLIPLARNGSTTLLRGNHETALLQAIDTQDLTAFLKMGGAATIRAYVEGDVGPDVIGDFRRAFPMAHLEAIRRMPARFRDARIIAQHEPLHPMSLLRVKRFAIAAHRPVGLLPRIGLHSADIDTGCSDEGGRLTAFLWPSRDYIQVDTDGTQI